ncbi:uncharacterized protein LOC124283446 isoform X2 [Haliotis rubra]|uniref:uncharacterized protein LOC124283446 isoform X2 n=1 Tax=Haliotis rubra TaxID=36100 RepID=UPI001EE58943|nr:uncharacterized protein LOC124283446 isoform X2 [Haliotis rubra]
MARHNEKQLRQGRGQGQEQGQRRGQGRGQGRGLGHDDLRYMLQIHDVGVSDVGHALDTDRRVEVVHRDIQDEVIIPNRSPTREASGHPLDKRTVEDIGRTSRKDIGKGNDADFRFNETSKRYGSQENHRMHLVRMRRSRKRLHPDNKSSGPSFFRNDRSRSPDRVRRKKHKLNVDKGEDNSTNQGYHNQREPARRNLPPAEIGANMRKYIKVNENVQDRMQSGTQRYTNCVTTTSVEPLDSEERLKSSSTAEKEDLASLILRTVCVDYPGITDLANLRKTLHQKKIINFSNTQTLYEFLKPYDNVFEIVGDIDRDERMIEDGEVEETAAEDKFLVTGHPNLLLCQQHSKKAGSCMQDCRSLHICKYFLLSKCTMQEQRKTCIFGHDMNTEHNKEVMRKSLLHKFKDLIEIDVLRSLRYRNSTTVPAICNYYNKPKGCNNAECGFMHVCSKFLHGTCSASYMCNFSHDIMAIQPLHCLQRYGISPSKHDEKEVVVKTLKSIATKKNHPVDQGRQVQSSTETQRGMFAGGYNKTIAKPNKRYQVARYFSAIGFSTSGEMKVSEKLTKARNQNEQLQLEVKERQEEKEKEINLRNSSTGVWTWSWMSPKGAWSDVTDSQIFEARYREYMQVRKRSFVINGKKCEVDFATKTGVIDGEVALRFKRDRKPECDTKCPTPDITDNSHDTDVAGSDADVATKTGVIDGEDALSFKRDRKPDCDTKCPTSDIMDDSHVTDVAGSDAGADVDVATKTGVIDGEDALSLKRVVKPDCDTKCPTSDIMDDSHVTDVAGSDAGADVVVATKTGVIDGKDALRFKRDRKPECDTKCPTPDIMDDSHVTDVAGSDAGAAVDVATKTGVIDGEDALRFKGDRKPDCDTKCPTPDIMDDSHVTDVAVSDAGADVVVATKTGVIDGKDALSFKGDMKPDCDTKCPTLDITDDSHVTDVAVSNAGADVDVARKTGVIDGEDALSFKRVVKPDCDTKCPTSDITDDIHVTDVAGSDAGADVDVATKTGVIDGEDALSLKRDRKPECDTNCPKSDIMDNSHVTDVFGSDAGADVDVVTKTGVIDGEDALSFKRDRKPECGTKALRQT